MSNEITENEVVSELSVYVNKELSEHDIQLAIVQLPNRPAAMLAKDLAEIYEVETGRLNEAVKRNIKRFPYDFMFQVTDSEKEILLSQNAISKNVPANPYLFTREGANQLSSVLQSEIAVERSVQIMRAFSKLESKPMMYSNMPQLTEYVKHTLSIANLFGLQGEQARNSANQAVKTVTGIDCMELLGINPDTKFVEYKAIDEISKTDEIDEKQIQYITLKEIAKALGTYKYMVESYLVTMKFHTYISSSIKYRPTQIGLEYCQFAPTGKTTKDGVPEMQTLWSSEVIDLIQNFRLP